MIVSIDSRFFFRGGIRWWRTPHGEELPLNDWDPARGWRDTMNFLTPGGHYVIGVYGPGALEMYEAWGGEVHTIEIPISEPSEQFMDLKPLQQIIGGGRVEGPQRRRRYIGKLTGETLQFTFEIKYKPGACHQAYWMRHEGEEELENREMWAVGVHDVCKKQDTPFTREDLIEEIGETFRWVGPLSGEHTWDPIWCPKPICWYASRKLRKLFKAFVKTYGFF